MDIKTIGIIGSGSVGKAIADGFAKLGYIVKIGSRSPEKLAEWVDGKERISAAPFAKVAMEGDALVLATKWSENATKNAIELAGIENFDNKIVIDITNPLVTTGSNKTPDLDVGAPDSGGQLIQSWIPNAKVVKAFNYITAAYMANPEVNGMAIDFFMTGNHDDAKKWVGDIANKWGWATVNDMGDIGKSYILEGFAMLWIEYAFKNGSWTHAFKMLKG